MHTLKPCKAGVCGSLLLLAAASVQAGEPETLNPLNSLRRESAAQRWERLKETYPLRADAAVTAQGEGSTAAQTAAPFPLIPSEPAWIVPLMPAEALQDVIANSASRVSTERVAVIAQDAAPPAEVEQPEAALPEPNGPAITDETPLAPVRRPLQVGELKFKRMHEITIGRRPELDGEIQEASNQTAKAYDVSFGDQSFQERSFSPVMMQWEVGNLTYYPLYFEDGPLERYGHTYNPVLQPFVSAGKFGGQLLALPYQMVLAPPFCEVSPLGWYAPGECAPSLHYQIPWNAKAAAVQAGVTTGMFFLIP